MALGETTISVACAIDAKQITVASATPFAIGNQVRIDGEIMKVTKGYVAASLTVPVLRGQDGTVAQAHAVTARVVAGTAADWTQESAPQEVVGYPIAGRARVVTSIGVAGAIPLPPAGNDALVLITGTALALSLVVPTKDLDGTILTLASTSAAAHVITVAGGIGGGALNTATFESTDRCNFSLMAMDEIWVPWPSPLSGTLTSIDVALTTV